MIYGRHLDQKSTEMDMFVFVVVILAFGAHVNAEEFFVFQAPQYSIEETATDNDDSSTVVISRSGDTEDTTKSRTININTECPNKVTPSASSDDFNIVTTVTFVANQLDQTVDITIESDDDEEFREFFCLTIVDDPGSENTVRIYIPGNDNCVHMQTPQSSTSDAANINLANYVGPWFVGESGYPDIIEITVLPEDYSDGDNTFIFLTDIANQDAVTDYYGILLDDSDASGHAGESDGDSVVVKNGLGAGNLVDNINDSGGSIAKVITGNEQTFTLQYTETTGTITLTDQSDPENKVYVATDGDASKVDVSHLFVASGGSYSSSWRVCGLLPRKLPIKGADASGYLAGYYPGRAFDGNRDPDYIKGGCFVSNEVVDPWLQIDLGREFDVKLVIIFPVDDSGENTFDDTFLNGAGVYVGSCPATSTASIKSNNDCDDNIGTVGNLGIDEIEITCDSYGRYVYIIQDTTSAVHINLCEVEVYGDDIPYGNEAMVEFSAPTFSTQDDESATTVSITAKRTGTSSLTCTTVDVYTDTIIPGGGSDDFTAILSRAPETLEWDDDDSSGTTKSVSVTIKNDAECEPTETFNVFLTNVNGGILGDQSCSSVSIIDDDSVTYALSSSTFSVNEGSTEYIGVTRTGTGNMQQGSAGLTFTDVTAQSRDYANAAATVDFSASSTSPQYHTLLTVEDQEYEGDETLTVTLGDLEPSTCSIAGSQHTATVTIIDDDSKFEWDVSDNDGFITIPESTAITSLSISREGVAQVKTINIHLNEQDADSSDFSISSSTVTFPVNEDMESVAVTVEDDSIVEQDESFTLTLEDPNYTTGHRNRGEPYRLTVTIQDDDAEYSWKDDRYEPMESDGNVRVCLVRRGDTSTTKTIIINSASNSATRGVDFTPPSEITFSGTSEACANVAITNDGTPEPTEVFSLTIASGQQDVALGDPSTTTVYIADDDDFVNWEIPYYTFEETPNFSDNFVTITKTGTSSRTVRITSQRETALEGEDYATVSTEVTFSGTRDQIRITIINDDKYEPSETFTLTLSGTGMVSSTTRITIVDDDPQPTEPPADGLSGGAIGGIAAAVVVGVIVIGVALAVFAVYSGVFGAANATAATAAVAAGPAAAQGLPLSHYQFSGQNGYGQSNQGYGGFNQPAFGFP